METFNSGVLERRQPARRNDSFSTIASSAAAEIMQQVQITQESSDASRYIASLRDQNVPSNNQTSMKFDNSEGVHVGDIIYNYYQNPTEIQSNQNVKKAPPKSSNVSDRLLKAKRFYQGKNRKRNFLITACLISLIVAISTAVPVTYFMINKNTGDKDESTTKSPPPANLSDFLVTREEWGANPPKSGIRKLSFPIRRIITGHTGGTSCSNENNCKMVVKAIQTDNSHLDDIPYNFLIGSDGRVYEGRGLENEGQHTSNKDASEFNSIGICIAFIGNYTTIAPSDSQLRVLNDFIEHFISQNDIDEEYIIVSQDDLMFKSVRADALNEAVSNFESYYPLQKVYRREEWNAASSTGTLNKLNQTMDLVMLSHTITGPCSTVANCAEMLRTMQRTNIEVNHYLDYAFSFAIGGDGEIVVKGLVFEGRGWDLVGAFFQNFNQRSIGIAAIGTFDSTEPSTGMLNSLQRMMQDGAALGKLRSTYKINGRIDFGFPGPGEAFMRHVREWCRYGNRTTECRA